MTCGIYQIVNVANGKIYIGSSCNIWSRWLTHRWALRKGRHHSTHLQKAWNKYGADSFSFELICEVPEEKLVQTEQIFLDALQCWKVSIGYNIATCAEASGRNMSKETRERISQANKGKPAWNKGKPCSETQKLKQSLAMQGRPALNKGKSPNKETREKISASLRGKPSWNKGKPWDEETRSKMSQAAKQKVISEKTRINMSIAHQGKSWSEARRKAYLALKEEQLNDGLSNRGKQRRSSIIEEVKSSSNTQLEDKKEKQNGNVQQH